MSLPYTKGKECGNVSMSRRNNDWKEIICMTHNKMKSLYLGTVDRATIQGGFPGLLFLRFIVLTLWHWSTFRISGRLWGGSSGHKCNPLYPPHNAQMFRLTWIKCCVNGHSSDIILMLEPILKVCFAVMDASFLCSWSGVHDYINQRKWHAHSRPV